MSWCQVDVARSVCDVSVVYSILHILGDGARRLQSEQRHRLVEFLSRDHTITVLVPLTEQVDHATSILRERLAVKESIKYKVDQHSSRAPGGKRKPSLDPPWAWEGLSWDKLSRRELLFTSNARSQSHPHPHLHAHPLHLTMPLRIHPDAKLRIHTTGVQGSHVLQQLSRAAP